MRCECYAKVPKLRKNENENYNSLYSCFDSTQLLERSFDAFPPVKKMASRVFQEKTNTAIALQVNLYSSKFFVNQHNSLSV